jgi:lactate dehydrogenase-like 2-hydroxyacid dehydrogenase
MAKPVLLVTRRLPPAVEARAARDYHARLNPEDAPRNGADIVQLAVGADAILCCPADRLDAAAITALPDTLRVIATYSVGSTILRSRLRRRAALPSAIRRACCRSQRPRR